jgi:DNA-binding IclR family transcriptional regulator
MTSAAKSSTSEAKGKSQYAAPALEKAFDVMELLASSPGGLMVTDIAALLNRSLGELFRIVVVMERRGYLEKDPETDRYHVSYKVLDLAYRATPTQHLIRTAAPIIHALAREIEQSCHLVVPNGGTGLVVGREENPGPRGFALKVGSSIDMARSCSGHIILAFSSPDKVERLKSTMPKGWERQFGKGEFESLLERVRNDGFDARPSPITHGVTDMSCPVFGFDGHLVAALTVPFLELIDGSQTMNFDAALARLQAAARAISTGLGWHEQTNNAESLTLPPVRTARRRKG